MGPTQQNMETRPYRPCVGIVVFNKDAKVWVGRRVVKQDSEPGETQKLWQFPQGGIDGDEAPIDAARRELYEETAMKNVTLLGEIDDWLRYDLPEKLVGRALHGQYCGQEQKWFAFQFHGEDMDIAINPPPAGNPTEFDAWQWIDIEKMLEMVVPFKQEIYKRVIAEFSRFSAL